MATSRICSVDGCDKPTVGRGLCRKHYNRWHRTGDPTKVLRRPNGTDLTFLTDVALVFVSDECLTWPYAKNNSGYGVLSASHGSRLAHRRVCEAANGKPPSDEHEAAHRCGNRLCVNPRHLRWATHAENQAECIEHGTSPRGARHGNSKLTEDDVRTIRSLHKSVGGIALSEQFGVSFQTIYKIINRTSWGWLD